MTILTVLAVVTATETAAETAVETAVRNCGQAAAHSAATASGHHPAFWLVGATIVILLALSAFFSASETALTASSRAKLRARADRGRSGRAGGA